MKSRDHSLRRGATLAVICVCHLVHDGLTDVLYVFLPFWQVSFDLPHSQIGLIMTAYMGALAMFQIPAGFLTERTGERALLIGGTVVAGLGFVVVGAVGVGGGFAGILLVLLIAGMGSGVQHPLGSSLVATAYRNGGQRMAIGTYNFAGDLGKVAFPFVAALALTSFKWPSVSIGAGLVAIVGAVCFLIAMQRLGIGGSPTIERTDHDGSSGRGWGIHNKTGFGLLSAIGIVDTVTRYGCLTFLPFILIDKGLSESRAGMALVLVFAGGAAGKFLCGFCAERLGVIRTVLLTEAVTVGGILLLVPLSPRAVFILLPVLGAALNGTSSVLYGSVVDFVVPQRQARAFGLFYTVVIASGAIAPVGYGFLSDMTSIRQTMTTIGIVAIATIPLAILMAWHTRARTRTN